MVRICLALFFLCFMLLRLAFAASTEGHWAEIHLCEKARSPSTLSENSPDRLLQAYQKSLCERFERGEISKKEFEAFHNEMTTAIRLEKDRRAAEKQKATGSAAEISSESALSGKQNPPFQRLEFLPEKLLYRPYLADPRRPRFSVKWLAGHKGQSQFDTAIGGYFPLLDIRRPLLPDQAFQVAGFAAVWSRWDIRENLDQLGTDFRGGSSFSYKRGSWAFRFQYLHESDHLGDELIERTGRKRIAYRRDEIGLGLAYSLGEDYRFYGEAGYGFALGDLNKPWRIQMGAEWEGSSISLLAGRPYAALDFQTWEESKWDPNVNTQLGIVYWNRKRSRSFRLSLDLYRGRDPLGEFFQEQLRYLTLGFSFDF